jgi:predicted nucleotidyltransferase
MKYGRVREMISNSSRFDKEIRSIVDQLVQLYKPDKIILFGSLVRDRGEPRDIDLFIIKKDVPELGVDRIRELDALIKYRLATDFIVYKPEEVKERLKLGDPFIDNIFKEGKVLYDAQ